MAYVNNLLLLAGEILLYFSVLSALFRVRHRLGIGVFYTALGALHFLETYLAAILYLQFPLGITISPGSSVLFAGKLVMLLLIYVREDAATVRQPIYGLFLGNLLMVGLVALMRFHDVVPAVPGKNPDFGFMSQTAGLMIWGTALLFIDSICIVLIYERTAAWFANRTLRICLSAAVVLSFDQLCFFAALRYFLSVPYEVLYGGWVAKVAAAAYGLLAGAYLRWVDRDDRVPAAPVRMGDLFDTLTYRQRYEALLRQSGRDSLTGLLNRGRFDSEVPDSIRLAVAAGRPISLLVIDLDHFKAINDEKGHPVGDEVLRLIAGEIGHALRVTDHIYRYGGEEFVVLCDGLSHAQALVAGERIRSRVETTPVPQLARPVTVSIGIATSPDDGVDLTELFSVADGRLYGAKETGRNRILGR